MIAIHKDSLSALVGIISVFATPAACSMVSIVAFRHVRAGTTSIPRAFVRFFVTLLSTLIASWIFLYYMGSRYPIYSGDGALIIFAQPVVALEFTIPVFVIFCVALIRHHRRQRQVS